MMKLVEFPFYPTICKNRKRMALTLLFSLNRVISFVRLRFTVVVTLHAAFEKKGSKESLGRLLGTLRYPSFSFAFPSVELCCYFIQKSFTPVEGREEKRDSLTPFHVCVDFRLRVGYYRLSR